METVPFLAKTWELSTNALNPVQRTAQAVDTPASESVHQDLVTLINRSVAEADFTNKEFLIEMAESIATATLSQTWISIATKAGRVKQTVCQVAKGRPCKEVSAIAVNRAMRDSYQAESLLGAGHADGLNLGTSAVLEKLMLEAQATSALGFSLPLELSGDRAILLMTFTDEAPVDHLASVVQALSAERDILSQQLDAWLICQAGRDWMRLRRQVNGLFSRRGLIAALVSAAVILGSCIPLPYLPLRDCTLEPARRSFVSSPIDGQLERSLVRPGDQVEKDQLIARIADQQLRRDLAAATAELESAAKRRDTALANRAGGDLQLVLLEHQQIKLRIDSIEARLGQLEIRSPADGVIVSGDWFGSDNASVTVGQTLFEIATLDRMTAEIRLSAADLSEIRLHCDVNLRSDSLGSRTWRGSLSRIEPRAEIIDQQAVFIAEMDAENPDGLLRPGMKAKVRLDAGYRSGGWILFHQPYRWFMSRLIW